MRKLPIILAVFAFFLLASPAWAVVTVTFKVTTNTGEPIPGAKITLTPKKHSGEQGTTPQRPCDRITVTTNENGESIARVPGGCERWDITFTADGFWKEKKKNVKLMKDSSIATELESQEPQDETSGGGGEGGGVCTHLYLVAANGSNHFLGYTLTALGEKNERWDSHRISLPAEGDIKIRLVKEMANEITFVDQVKVLVVDKDPLSGKTRRSVLEPVSAFKNGSETNLVTVFRKDGNHIPIRSSAEPDPLSYWGVKKGDILELTFKAPPIRKGFERNLYVMTLGYHLRAQ